MSSEPARPQRSGALLGVGLFMVLCCAIGPAVIAALAGSAIGGWLGITIACVLAAVVALAIHLRRRGRGGC